MRWTDALQLAFRAISAQRLRSFLTLLGIAVGIAAVILLTSIGEGIHRFVLAEFTQFGTNVITALPGKTKTGGTPSGLPSSARPLTLEDASALERLPYVVAVTPNVRGNAEVEGNGRTRRTLIYGVNANLPRVFRSTVQSGQFLPPDELGSARAFVVRHQGTPECPPRARRFHHHHPGRDAQNPVEHSQCADHGGWRAGRHFIVGRRRRHRHHHDHRRD
jgi:putative ABC transport system permease protein